MKTDVRKSMGAIMFLVTLVIVIRATNVKSMTCDYEKKTAAPRIVFKKMNAVEYATKAHAPRAATLQSFAI